MREILFRGKDLFGKWVQGDLLQYMNSQILYIVQNYTGAGGREVVPETVGQYIGITDNNGKKIFEGDIIRLCYSNNNNPDTKPIYYNDLIIFKNGRFCAIDGTEDDHSFERPILTSYLNCEVIGNKYDNPELLEKIINDI